ncbi:MAG: adenylate cyclase [Acidobacteriota bacterium]|nr:adenylate cyclase [Acidobacteriota bacterium]
MSNMQIGKYRLLERIGQGAMGEVFRAHDPVLDRQVAVKIINAGDDERRQRFHREAQSAARLAHPNIVVVHDFGEDDGRFFMAMELLDGIDLKEAIARKSLPDVESKLSVMEQACDALSFAHARSIVHRDLKPANIFLLDGHRVKIVDFGLARIEQSDMTGTGMILGTPNYMAPEQIKGSRIDGRADIFALGAVFYELLAGRKAFDADSLHSVLYKVLQYEPESLRTAAGTPSSIAEIVEKALSKDPERRYQGVLDMRDAIRALRGIATASVTLSGHVAGLSIASGTVVLRENAISVNAAPAAQVTLVRESGGDVVIAATANQTLLAASLAAGVPHVHECGGHARCSTCRVLVIEGAANLSPRDSAELKLAKRLGFGDDIRLACQTKTRGPVRLRRLILDADDVRLANAEKQSPMAGTEVPLAVVYANIREFSTLMRRALAYDVVHILNRYYLQVGEAVLANGGHIDRYTGGGLLALFGVNGEDAKTKCTNAIRAALRMQKRMEVFNKHLTEHFGLTFTLDIGVHYGRMVVGHIGHPDHARLTAVGDASNLTMSMADLHKEHDAHILATEELINIVEGDVACGTISHELLGGRDREYTLYEVLDFAKPDTHYLVQSSWETIVGRREEAARIFYSRLFEIAPAVRPMFAGVDISTQGSMLMNMITAAVRGLDRLEELKPTLEDLGRRHAAYGVRVEHYAPVEECLLHTVEVMMGEGFNLDVKLAWTQIYNFIAGTMIDAASA